MYILSYLDLCKILDFRRFIFSDTIMDENGRGSECDYIDNN